MKVLMILELQNSQSQAQLRFKGMSNTVWLVLISMENSTMLEDSENSMLLLMSLESDGLDATFPPFQRRKWTKIIAMTNSLRKEESF